MQGIKDKYAKKWGLDDNSWEQMIFTFVNPTNSDVTIDPFDPQVANTFNYPTSPVGTIPNVFTPITVAPSQSVGVEYDTVNNKVWSGDRVLGFGTVYTYSDNPPQTSPATFNTIATVQSGITSLSFSPSSNKVAVGSLGSAFVTIIDATTETVIANVLLPFVGVNWIEYNPLKNTWYVSAGVIRVYEIDCVTNTLLAVIPLAVGAIPSSISINTNNNTAYVCDRGVGNDKIFKINCITNTVVLVIPTGLLITPSSILINSNVNKAYVGSFTNTGIWTFNTLTDTFISNIAPLGIASDFLIHSDSNSLYTVGKRPLFGQALRFDLTTDLVQGSPINFAQTIDFLTLAFSPLQNIIYFSSSPILKLNSLVPSQNTSLYIVGTDSDNYNQVVRDGFYNPYLIRRMYYYSDNDANFNQIFFHTYKDANGNLVDIPQNPNISVGTMQFQSRFGQLDYPNQEVILGINQWYKGLIVKAHSQITMLFIYQQLDKSELFTSAQNGSMYAKDDFDDFVNRFNQVRKLTLSEILENKIMPLQTQSEDLVRPFSIDSFNELLNKSNE